MKLPLVGKAVTRHAIDALSQELINHTHKRICDWTIMDSFAKSNARRLNSLFGMLSAAANSGENMDRLPRFYSSLCILWQTIHTEIHAVASANLAAQLHEQVNAEVSANLNRIIDETLTAMESLDLETSRAVTRLAYDEK
jgi:hypothetical protein